MNRISKKIRKKLLIFDEEYLKSKKRYCSEKNYFFEKQNILYSEIKTTKSISETTLLLSVLNFKNFKINEDDIVITEKSEKVFLSIQVILNKEIFEKINKEMNNCGWVLNKIVNSYEKKYINFNLAQKENNNQLVKFIYKSKFEIEIDCIEIPKKLYFFIEKEKINEIIKNGINYKTKPKLINNPDKIFLIKPCDKTNINFLLKKLFKKSIFNLFNQKKQYILLEINFSENYYFKLFKYSKIENVYYGYNDIPQKAITPIREYELNNKGEITSVIDLNKK